MAEPFLPVLYVMLFLGTIVLSYAVYGRYYIKSDTKLMFNLEDPICFNPEFHHQFLKQQMAKLPDAGARNDPEAMVQLIKLELADGPLNVAVPFSSMRFQVQSPDEEISVSSAYDVNLESAGRVPYVYGADVRVSAADHLVSRLLVARDNLRIKANSVEADGLLANGDVEIASAHTRVTRVAGFGYEFLPGQPLPDWARQAFNFRRYNYDASRRQAFINTTSIPANSIMTENVVCGGDLAVGNLSTIHGAVKVYGSMRVDERVVFLGPVVVNGDLDAPSGCVFMSDVVVKGDMRVAGYMVAGQPMRHAVCVVARSLDLSGKVAGSGTLVASEQDGLCHAA
jgi:hypothetical protein